jgi:hypothetical protein
MRKTVLFVLGALWIGLCLSACESGGGDDGMSQEEWFNVVKIGMTMDQIVAVVGRPADSADYAYSGNRKWLVYYWRFGNAVGTASFGKDGKAVSVGYSPNWYG